MRIQNAETLRGQPNMLDECLECREMYDRHLYDGHCPKCETVDAFAGIMSRIDPVFEKGLSEEELEELFNE